MTDRDPFALPDARMEGWSWFRDGLHVPRPIPALVGDAQAVWTQVAMGGQVAVVNGYLYMAMGAPSAARAYSLESPPQNDAIEAWSAFYLPRVRAICDRIREADWDALSSSELAEGLRQSFRDAGIGFAYTMAPLMAISGPVMMLMQFAARYLGEGSDLRALTMLQGRENETAASGTGLANLAALARSLPDVAAALRRRDFNALSSVAGAHEFEHALNAYLADYGRGTQTWFEFHRPTWEEDRSVPLGTIAAMLDAPQTTGDARARSVAGREAAVAEAMAALPGEGERTQLAGILVAAQDYVAIIEERARWQQTLSGVQRKPALALGRRLVEIGAINAPDDVFYLHLHEAADLLFSGRGSRDLVAERAADLARWAKLAPPESLGAPFPPGAAANPMMAKMFGLGAIAGPAIEGVVRGQPASRGVARGVARVVLDLDDAERLRPGDILVCPFTAPPWTPLFSIAGAVVTDAGGVLSHAAIEAREYGIPGVVGTKRGTRAIPDGATVEVDGGAGTVTILGLRTA